MKECNLFFKRFAMQLCLNVYIIFTFVIHSFQKPGVLNTYYISGVIED